MTFQRPLAHVPHVKDEAAASFRLAMRELAGGVSVITTGVGALRTGLTATSVSSLSAEPPTVVVCVNKGSSTWPVLAEAGFFAVNVLSADQRDVADRFAGRGGYKGAARYEGAQWTTLLTGAPVLAKALVALDCELEELIDRHSHSIVIGRVKAVQTNQSSDALVYWRGDYDRLRVSAGRPLGSPR